MIADDNIGWNDPVRSRRSTPDRGVNTSINWHNRHYKIDDDDCQRNNDLG